MKMTTLANPAKWLLDWLGGGSSKVTAQSMLTNAAVWYGIGKITGNVGTLPLNLMRSLPDGGAEKAKDHFAYPLLRSKPNNYQTPFVWKQTMIGEAIRWGNGRSFIHRPPGGQSELIPLRPDATVSALVHGEKLHFTMPKHDDRLTLFEDMQKNPNNLIVLDDADVLHIQGYGDGVEGISLFSVARTSLGISLAGDERANKQATKGFLGRLMFEAPVNSPQFRNQADADEFLKSARDEHSNNKGGEELGLLRGGMTANVLNMSNTDAQFLQGRQYQREEASLWLGLESQLFGDTAISYNSEEQRQLAYLKNCLSNWLTRTEQECDIKLLTPTERETLFFRFNVAALLRTDTQTTMATLSTGITARIFSPNDARAKLDENPYDGGDSYENPAISPGPTGGDSSPPATATMAPPRAEMAAIQTYMEHMLSVEQKRVTSMLADGADHAKLDEWYQGWCERLGEAIESFGGDRSLAQAHCVENLKYLQRNPETFDLTGSAELLAKNIIDSLKE